MQCRALAGVWPLATSASCVRAGPSHVPCRPGCPCPSRTPQRRARKLEKPPTPSRRGRMDRRRIYFIYIRWPSDCRVNHHRAALSDRDIYQKATSLQSWSYCSKEISPWVARTAAAALPLPPAAPPAQLSRPGLEFFCAVFPPTLSLDACLVSLRA